MNWYGLQMRGQSLQIKGKGGNKMPTINQLIKQGRKDVKKKKKTKDLEK